MEVDNNQKRPIQSVSFHDLASMGITVYTQEFEKEKPDGRVATAVKVVKVTKEENNTEVEVSKDYIQQLLYILGIETYDQSLRWWVSPKRKHRCLSTQSPVYDYRYQGYERTDKQWLISGRASQDAIMYSSRMSDMSSVTNQLENGGDGE
jgi:hypothetical protein